MSRSVRLVLLSITVFLVLFPLTAARPGQPPTLKADEPAYFLMALSLAQDGDLQCNREDIERAFDHYPYLPLNNLILMSADGWETVFFGKPYIYSLLAAPAAALFGTSGIVAFNMVLLLAMVWMGASYLRRFNSDALAALFSTLFFLLSPAFAYAFWLHPEIFNMFSVAACLYLAFREPEDGEQSIGWIGRTRSVVFGPAVRPVWSAAALALGVYNKPVLALLGLPALFLFFRQRGWKGALTFIAAGGLALAMIAGISVSLTGQPSAYLGVDRGGMKVLSPVEFEKSLNGLRQATEGHSDEAANSWQWIFRWPEVKLASLAENARFFLIGRHTGLVPYMPFAALTLLLFLLHERRSAVRWINVAALVAVALFFLVWIPFNWHGGGGFIGNRYFINAYPAFLFLVTAIRPAWLTVAGSGFAALLLGSILFSPWGLSVPQPTLQAHVRGGLFRFFPLELSLRNQIPGYDRFGYAGLGFMGRRDLFRVLDASQGVMWLRGATQADIWIYSYEPLKRMLFEVATATEDNEIVLSLPGVEKTVTFEGAKTRRERRKVVELTPSRPTHVRNNGGKPEIFYLLKVSTRTGQHEGGNMLNAIARPLFYIGAQLTFVGTQAELARDERFRISWEECDAPDETEAGARLQLPIRARNEGEDSWPARGPTPVQIAYEWIDRDGVTVDVGQKRTRIRRDVPPAGEVAMALTVIAPETPGSYTLVFDAVRKHIGWFSERGGAACKATVEVAAPTVEGEPAEDAR